MPCAVIIGYRVTEAAAAATTATTAFRTAAATATLQTPATAAAAIVKTTHVTSANTTRWAFTRTGILISGSAALSAILPWFTTRTV